MRIAILHQAPGPGAQDQDVLVQRDSVGSALSRLGHNHDAIACSLDLGQLREQLTRVRADCVFNLVESLGGTDRLASLVPLLLESMGVPYTGTRATTIAHCADKIEVKRRLRDLGILTPAWHAMGEHHGLVADRYIVKARYEHASLGMDDSSVVDVDDPLRLAAFVSARSAAGVEMFAEQFIAGREFNLSMLEDANGNGRALPAAEIDFSLFPDGKPRIVGYDAKWVESSLEYAGTPRTFVFGDRDLPLLARLRELSEMIWHAFALTGYARVDFRIDPAGNPWVLEINANPCLSPDAGFQAALVEAGISFDAVVERLVTQAMKVRHGG